MARAGDLHAAALGSRRPRSRPPPARAALAGDRQARARGVVDPAALQTRMTRRRAPRRRPGRRRRPRTPRTPRPRRPARRCPTPAGLSTVQRRTVGRAPPRTSMPAAERVTIRTSGSSGAPVLDEQRRPRSSPGPPHAGPGPPRRRARSAATPSAGAIRTEPAEPSGPRSVTARSTHQVLPVGAGRDGEDVAVRRGLQGGGERRVLTRAAPPPRCSGVRHLDRALCHGAAVPPPLLGRRGKSRKRAGSRWYGRSTVACAGTVG